MGAPLKKEHVLPDAHATISPKQKQLQQLHECLSFPFVDFFLRHVNCELWLNHNSGVGHGSEVKRRL